MILGVVTAVTLLSDRLGGLGELWDRVWNGMKLTVLTNIRGILTPLDLLIKAINATIDGWNRINFLGADVDRITNPVESIDRAIGDAARGTFAPVTTTTNNNQRSRTIINNIMVENLEDEETAQRIANAIELTPDGRD